MTRGASSADLTMRLLDNGGEALVAWREAGVTLHHAEFVWPGAACQRASWGSVESLSLSAAGLVMAAMLQHAK